MFSEKTTTLCKEACAALQYNYDEIMGTASAFPEKHGKSIVAYAMLCAVIEHANKKKDPEWKPDYNTCNRKYWTWHIVEADEARPAGFGFSGSDYGYAASDSTVGSRLYFQDRQLEEEMREPLEELYIAYKLYE